MPVQYFFPASVRCQIVDPDNEVVIPPEGLYLTEHIAAIAAGREERNNLIMPKEGLDIMGT